MLRVPEVVWAVCCDMLWYVVICCLLHIGFICGRCLWHCAVKGVPLIGSNLDSKCPSIAAICKCDCWNLLACILCSRIMLLVWTSNPVCNHCLLDEAMKVLRISRWITLPERERWESHNWEKLHGLDWCRADFPANSQLSVVFARFGRAFREISQMELCDNTSWEP